MPPPERKPPAEGAFFGNFVSEWFGHRVHPVVARGAQAFDDQRTKRCPFLTEATGQDTECVKSAASKGICTISSTSNGPRQDWLICPNRALVQPLLETVARQLFKVPPEQGVVAVPVTVLARAADRAAFTARIEAGDQGFFYFTSKLGGKISISATDRSPEMSFDTMLVQVIRPAPEELAVGRYGILEVQTMDFHGSYREVVHKLLGALDLHDNDDEFHNQVQEHPQWLSEKIEGPNIANVFKRTFYQMMLKFQIGADETCAGCVMAIPTSVWDSWQRHLGKPDLTKVDENGTYTLAHTTDWQAGRVPAWLYVFDIDASGTVTPSPIERRMWIGTDAASVAHYALEVVPQAAAAGAGSTDRVMQSIRQRVRKVWPLLAGEPVKLPPFPAADADPVL